MQTDVTPSTTFTLRQAAEALGCSLPTMRRAVRSGRLAASTQPEHRSRYLIAAADLRRLAVAMQDELARRQAHLAAFLDTTEAA